MKVRAFVLAVYKYLIAVSKYFIYQHLLILQAQYNFAHEGTHALSCIWGINIAYVKLKLKMKERSMLKTAFCFQPVKCFTRLEIRPCGWVKSWQCSWKIKNPPAFMVYLWKLFLLFLISTLYFSPSLCLLGGMINASRCQQGANIWRPCLLDSPTCIG